MSEPGETEAWNGVRVPRGFAETARRYAGLRRELHAAEQAQASAPTGCPSRADRRRAIRDLQRQVSSLLSGFASESWAAGLPTRYDALRAAGRMAG